MFLNSSKLAAGAALCDRLRMKLFDVEALVVVSLILRAVSGLTSSLLNIYDVLSIEYLNTRVCSCKYIYMYMKIINKDSCIYLLNLFLLPLGDST